MAIILSAGKLMTTEEEEEGAGQKSGFETNA